VRRGWSLASGHTWVRSENAFWLVVSTSGNLPLSLLSGGSVNRVGL
jgi:hypothetical protein